MRRIMRLTLGTVVIWSVLLLSTAWAADNGTVTFGGLVVLKDAGCLGSMSWNNASSTAASLSAATAPAQCNLKDGSTAGQWRLPSIGEINTISQNKSQLINVQYSYYWTSYKSVLDGYYGVKHLGNRQDGSHPQSNLYYVVPVRNP